MKKPSLTTSYIIYIFTCISIIGLYLYSTILREDSEILKQPVPLISQYYDLKTVALIGAGLNLYYYFYVKNKNQALSRIHLIISLILCIFGLYGVIAIMIPR